MRGLSLLIGFLAVVCLSLTACSATNDPFESQMDGDAGPDSDGVSGDGDSVDDTDNGDTNGDADDGDSECIECLPDECGTHPRRCDSMEVVYCGDCPECQAILDQVFNRLASVLQCTPGVDTCEARSINGPCHLVGCWFPAVSGADLSDLESLVDDYTACAGIGYPQCSCGGPPPLTCIGGMCQTPGLACGDSLTCDTATQVCVGRVAPVGGEVTHSCEDLPPACDMDRTCGCLDGDFCIGELSDCMDIAYGSIACHCSSC